MVVVGSESGGGEALGVSGIDGQTTGQQLLNGGHIAAPGGIKQQIFGLSRGKRQEQFGRKKWKGLRSYAYGKTGE